MNTPHATSSPDVPTMPDIPELIRAVHGTAYNDAGGDPNIADRPGRTLNKLRALHTLGMIDSREAAMLYNALIVVLNTQPPTDTTIDLHAEIAKALKVNPPPAGASPATPAPAGDNP